MYKSDRISKLVPAKTPLSNTRNGIEAGRSGGGGGPEKLTGWGWFGWLHVVRVGLKGAGRQSQPLACSCSSDSPGASAIASALIDVDDATGWDGDGILDEPLHPAASMVKNTIVIRMRHLRT